jgi:hypothetical protein
MGHQNRRHASNIVRLLLVSQWLQVLTKSVMHALTTHLRFACNWRHTTFSASPISATVTPGGNQIGDARFCHVSQIFS